MTKVAIDRELLVRVVKADASNGASWQKSCVT